MSDTTALQRLHKRLSDATKEPIVIVRLLQAAPIAWEISAKNEPIDLMVTDIKQTKPIVVNWIVSAKNEPIELIKRNTNVAKPNAIIWVRTTEKHILETINITNRNKKYNKSTVINWMKQTDNKPELETIKSKNLQLENVKHNSRALVIRFMNR